jgi:hypothetical protein
MPMDAVIKVLAVIGGGVVGGLIVGWLVRVLTLLLTGQKLPRAVHWLFRVLGALIVGWLTWWYVFGGGGLGGPGGPGSGGPNDGKTPATTDGTKDKDKKDKKEENPPQPDPSGPATPDFPSALGVELLAPDALQRLKPGTPAQRSYRLWKGAEFLTLAEVEQAIQDRQKKSPSLRYIFLVFYRDSPDPDEPNQPMIRQLREWAQDLTVQGDGEKKEKVRVLNWTQPLENKEKAPRR